jgi:hypothetical protein
MTTAEILIALTSVAAVVALSTACVDTSNAPGGTASNTSAAITTPPTPITSAPVPGAESSCTDLGGTVDPSRTCKVHDATPSYTIDMSYPIDYTDQQALTGALKRLRTEFLDALKDRPDRDRPYALDITGTAYRSGTPAAGTQSLVFKEYIEVGAAHPETNYLALNYDLGKRAPITFDTLFKPGADTVAVLDPIVRRGLEKNLPGLSVEPNITGAQAYQNFALTDDAVIFFIGQGIWLAEAAGPQEVSVPRSELASILS